MVRGIVTGNWDQSVNRDVRPQHDILRLWDETTDKINRLWPQIAAARFQDCLQCQPGDRLIEVYIERCRALMARPPREWTGVHYAAHK